MVMSPNRRILLNILATYGRSLFALVCGLFTGRWILMALGEVDYGLYGVVGGLTVFIAFFNGLLAGAMGRFYAVSIGQAQVSADRAAGLEECQRWFNTAVTIHFVIPLILMSIGYPMGEYAVRHWLTIPSDRVMPCVLVFRMACVSCLISMLNVPFTAMYTAKQYIAELTVYSFMQTVANVCFVYYMVTHPRDWLVGYSIGACFVFAIPQLIICFRALRVFPECKFNWRYMFDFSRLKQLGNFAGWQMVGALGGLLRGQGIAVVVNKFLGPRMNASISVANTVNSHAGMLSSAMNGAFMPAITTAYGAGDYLQMKRLAIRACKFGTLLSLVFFVPLALELSEVMRLWLKTPPPHSTLFCLTMMLAMVIDGMTVGHMVVVQAVGKIALYQSVLGGFLLLTIPIAIMLLLMGLGVYAISVAIVLPICACSLGRVWFAKKLAGMEVSTWALKVFLPVCFAVIIVGVAGALPRVFMNADFIRVVVTTAVCEAIFVPLVWCCILDGDERAYIRERFKRIRGKLS